MVGKAPSYFACVPLIAASTPCPPFSATLSRSPGLNWSVTARSRIKAIDACSVEWEKKALPVLYDPVHPRVVSPIPRVCINGASVFFSYMVQDLAGQFPKKFVEKDSVSFRLHTSSWDVSDWLRDGVLLSNAWRFPTRGHSSLEHPEHRASAPRYSSGACFILLRMLTRQPCHTPPSLSSHALYERPVSVHLG